MEVIFVLSIILSGNVASRSDITLCIKMNKPTVVFILCNVIWASARENLSLEVCEQQRCRPASASAQSVQRLCYWLFDKYHI